MSALEVGVLGAGTMGNGIAQVFAQAGHSVVLRDLDQAILDRALGNVRKSLGKLAEKGRLPAEERDAALGRLRTATDLSALAGCDLVVEAIVEKLEVKLEIFRELDRLSPSATLLASKTMF